MTCVGGNALWTYGRGWCHIIKLYHVAPMKWKIRLWLSSPIFFWCTTKRGPTQWLQPLFQLTTKCIITWGWGEWNPHSLVTIQNTNISPKIHQKLKIVNDTPVIQQSVVIFMWQHISYIFQRIWLALSQTHSGSCINYLVGRNQTYTNHRPTCHRYP